MHSHHVSPKRERRRAAREALLGPERRIVVTSGDVHELECGHGVWVRDDERPHIQRRRCKKCLRARGVSMAEELNRVFAHVPAEYAPEFCSECGAGRGMVPVEGTGGRWYECRECHALVRAKGIEK